ncbi:3-oxoacyl-[acyl-carrier protein] reductase [Prauserella shujinwangii]|uniref:3-oxoacyl-[acyl-carrier protein] reductase n=1 Tax=Prauserella shujinwangii TaxID=1453103 RepID=A0A2T0M1S3_9PSEU|nr:3-oxoacyl-ACP reductase family protein [Prauserella shujinwangii]PRX50554.1 3-oxoacyl-[acyl-carrier protein] reductase [Prauserella shujinwangii]
MERFLDNKVALVTGGSRGIGAGVATRLAEHGADVALTYRDHADSADAVAERIKGAGRRALPIRADSADPGAVTTAVDRVVAEFGRLDVLVNNVGVFPVAPLESLDLDTFDEAMAANVRAPFLAAKAAAGHLADGGRIVTIGSHVAERVAFPGFSIYATTKAALTGLTKALGRELGPRGITVNLVSPGPTDTDLNPADGPNAELIKDLTALGRYGSPDEIAAAVAFLASEGGAYVTGTTITVDGGFNI